MPSSKIIENPNLVLYKGGSHGICTTENECVNAGLLAFVKG